MTEPFTDFTVDTGLGDLGLTRTYSSNDWSYEGGPVGPFGRGWHHDWEAFLTCDNGLCTIGRGLAQGWSFHATGFASSLDGAEQWQIFSPMSDPALKDDHHHMLVRRPNGDWIAFLSDGRELRFQTACDACGDPAADPTCLDPLEGGRARLVQITDPRGNPISVGYDRPNGVLLRLQDSLGHELQLRSSSACGSGLAEELWYDGMTVATYEYSGLDLARTVDADQNVLRSYLYETNSAERLRAVLNEAGDAITEFQYDVLGRATGLVDAESTVFVDYDAPDGIHVTEHHGSTSTTSVRALDRDGHITSISEGCACGPPRAFTWKDGRLACAVDADNHVTWREYDAQGRVTRESRYMSTLRCGTRPATLPVESREEWLSYGLVKPIAQGVSIPLDAVTQISRKSVYQAKLFVAESVDYDPAPQPFDPPGYVCQAMPLPVGSGPCRSISGGYTFDTAGAAVFERHATFYSYDARGRVARVLGPMNLDRPAATDVTPVEERVYWPDDESLARRGRLRDTRRYPSASAPPHITTYDYDAFGPFSITQPNGTGTTFVKDGRGRTRYVATADGVRELRYHDGLAPRLVLSPGGGAVRSIYDAAGRLSSVEYLTGDPEQAGATPARRWSEHYLYDPAGNRIRTERRDESGTVTFVDEREFDVQHRPTALMHPELLGVSRGYTYSASGLIDSTLDEERRAAQFTPDGLGRVKSVRRSGFDSTGAATSLTVATYTYTNYTDALSRVVDGANRTTTYRYDDFGKATSIQTANASGGAFTFFFDARGSVIQKRQGTRITVDWTYDGLDRPLSMSARNTLDGSQVSFTYAYDEAGHTGSLTSVSDGDRTFRYTYDAAKRLESESIEEGAVAPLVTRYVHDADGRLSGVVHPSGLQLIYERDPATQEIVRVLDGADGTAFASNVVHAPAGPIISLAYGNGLTMVRTLNRRYETRTLASGPLSLDHSLNPAGDVGATTEGGTARTFIYDFLDRLTEISSEATFSYDGNGNRTADATPVIASSYTYSGDRIARRTVPGATAQIQTHGFAYDYQGNLTGVVQFGPTGSTIQKAMCLRHDALGRLTTAGPTAGAFWSATTACTADSNLQSVTARFTYDHSNRRIARWTSSGWTYVVSDASGRPLTELAKPAVPTMPWVKLRDYVWLDDVPIAQVEYSGTGERHTYFFHVDQIGLPRALTNRVGQTVWTARPGYYGDVTETASGDPISGRMVVTNLRLPGQYDERLLGSVGLQGPYYNWARWYLPGVGRYMELDPIALEGGFNAAFGANWYGYGNGNPLRHADPYGESALADACENAMSDARATAAQIDAQKNFSDDTGFLDWGHKKKARNAQRGLRDALRRIKKFCPCPDSPEIRKWEELANWDPDSVPDHLKFEDLLDFFDKLPPFLRNSPQAPIFIPFPTGA